MTVMSAFGEHMASASEPINPNMMSDVKENKYSLSKGDIWNTSKNLVIMRHYNNEGWRLFLKEKYLNPKSSTWHELNRDVNAYFEKVKAELQAQWGLKGQLLSAAYYTAIAGHLFSVGAPVNNDGVKVGPRSIGRAFVDRYKRSNMAVPPVIPLKFYLNASQGNCNDFATMLYMLLNLNQIPAYHVGIKGHIHVEAVIDGQPYVFDALALLFAPYGVEAFYKRNKDCSKKKWFELPRKYIHLLPNASEDPASLFFRRQRGMRNAFNCLTASMVNRDTIRYEHWDLFEIYLKLNGVPRNPKSFADLKRESDKVKEP